MLDLVLGDEVLPFVAGWTIGHGLDEMALVKQAGIAQTRLLDEAELSDQLDFEPSLLADLASCGVLNCLAGLDSATGHDAGELGRVDSIEDEQLVGSGRRMLTGDVNDYPRAAGQLDWARIFALWARLAAW